MKTFSELMQEVDEIEIEAKKLQDEYEIKSSALRVRLNQIKEDLKVKSGIIKTITQ